MGDYFNPSKKPRLEGNLDDWENEFAGNDDLWGHDELTAEEFDMLENQASQANKQNDKGKVDLCVPGPSNTINKCNNKTVRISAIEVECDESILEKYALEGKVKALTNSLEKISKELTDERLSREQIINSRLDQYKNKESSLLQKVEQLETAIHFKEQEMRAERTKILALESKLKEQGKESHSYATQDVAEKSSFRNLFNNKKSPSKFLNRYDFEARNQVKGIEVAAQTESPLCRKYQLPLQSPEGEIRGADMVSMRLRSKVFSSSVFDNFQACNKLCSKEMCYTNEIFRKLPCPSASIALLSNGEEMDNFWESYEMMFQKCLPVLKKSNVNQLETPVFPQKRSRTSSDEPKISCSNAAELDCSSAVVWCLRDIACLLLYRCPKQSLSEASGISDKVLVPKNETDILSAHSRPLFNGDEEKMEVVETEQELSLGELLCAFANPDSYSAEYSRDCEIEYALLASLAWSFHSVKSLAPYVCSLPLHSLVSGKFGIGCASLSLKLMLSFLTSPHFQKELIHQPGCCIFCSIGSLCHSIHSCVTYHSTCLVITMVEDFLCGIFATIDFTLFNEDSCPCSSLVLQGVISMLWRATAIGQDHHQPCCFSAVRKGIILLSFMANHVENFRVRRMPVKDSYVTLICGLSKLCRENVDFKRIQDSIRDLWDFQDDTNEFDVE